jgi:hypothetical protein
MDKVIAYAFKLWLGSGLAIPVIHSIYNRLQWTTGQPPLNFLTSWTHYGASVMLSLMLTGPCLLLYLVAAALTYYQKVYLFNSRLTMLMLSVAAVVIDVLLINLSRHSVSSIQWLLITLVPVVILIFIIKPLPLHRTTEPAVTEG